MKVKIRKDEVSRYIFTCPSCHAKSMTHKLYPRYMCNACQYTEDLKKSDMQKLQ